jgi:hypothetical protein
MQPLDVDKLTADTFAEKVSELNGKYVSVTGYIRSVGKRAFSVCKSQTSLSHIKFERSAVLAAFEDEKREGQVTFLIASDAQVDVVRRCDASQIDTSDSCGCGPGGVGVVAARPYKSIHPLLAAAQAEYLAIMGSIGTGPGARELSCQLGYHDDLIGGVSADEAGIRRDACLMGIGDPNDPTGILW